MHEFQIEWEWPFIMCRCYYLVAMAMPVLQSVKLCVKSKKGHLRSLNFLITYVTLAQELL